jgi:hypothetical protein
VFPGQDLHEDLHLPKLSGYMIDLFG